MEKIKKLLKNKKIILGMILLILIIVCIIVIISKSNNDVVIEDNGIIVHTEKGIVKDEEYKGIKFSNISMITKEGYTTFSADVTNISEKDIETEKLHISLKDKDDKEVIKLLAYIPNGLKKGETKIITASAYGKFENVVTKIVTE